MPRGGYRENAGRKQGTPNKATAARQAEVAASGITPLEVMLDNMRVAHQRAKELEKLLSDLPPEEFEARLQLMGEIAAPTPSFPEVRRRCRQLCASEARGNLARERCRPPADHFRRRTGERSARAARQRRDRPALSIGHRTSRGGRNARPVTIQNLDESKFTAYPAGTFYSEPPS
jgi:hypothetical protein